MIHCYKLNGYNIVLDPASGAIHSADDVAFDAVSMFGAGTSPDAIIARLSEKYAGRPDVTESELREVIADIERLRADGKLFSKDIFPDAPVRNAEKTPLKALCLNVAHACNMTCSYCFARHSFSGGGDALMSLETGKRAIDFLLENSGERKNLEVDFFGGEPLLNWEVVKGIVLYAREREAAYGRGKSFRFTLTTNGLLIDEDVIAFTSREMRNVVLSLDGRRETHDRYRRLADGGGSYDAVLPKLKRMADARGGKDYYIRGTFTRENLDFTNDIIHMAELGFTELSLEPAVAETGDPRALTESELPQIFEQYERLACEMLKREKEGRGFNFYHYTLDLTGGPCVYKRITGCGSGTEYLAVTPGGELYACHQLVGNPVFLMGDIWRGVTNTKLRDEFSGCSVYTREECRECWARMYCGGGCAANAYNASGSVGGVYTVGCEMFKKRIECAVMMKTARAVR